MSKFRVSVKCPKCGRDKFHGLTVKHKPTDAVTCAHCGHGLGNKREVEAGFKELAEKAAEEITDSIRKATK